MDGPCLAFGWDGAQISNFLRIGQENLKLIRDSELKVILSLSTYSIYHPHIQWRVQEQEQEQGQLQVQVQLQLQVQRQALSCVSQRLTSASYAHWRC